MPTTAKNDVKDSAHGRRDYRCFEETLPTLPLANALSRDETNEVNFSKFDQLTAMRWCLAS